MPDAGLWLRPNQQQGWPAGTTIHLCPLCGHALLPRPAASYLVDGQTGAVDQAAADPVSVLVEAALAAQARDVEAALAEHGRDVHGADVDEFAALARAASAADGQWEADGASVK